MMSSTTRSGRGAGGLVVGVALLGTAAWFGVRAAMRGEPVPEPTLVERYLADDRIRPLIYDCNFGKTFNASTADMTAVLVSKLDLGARDPLKIAKKELAAEGERAIEPLRRLFDEAFQDPWRGGVVENVLATCTLMKEPWGVDMLRFAVGHQQESVRLAAMKGLRIHGDETDYDSVLFNFPMASSAEAMAEYATCLEALDAERFYADFAAWLERGEYPGIWSYMIVSACAATDPQTVAKLKELAELRDEALIPFLLAPAARDGDQEALDELHRRLASERGGQRQLALQALGEIGRNIDAVTVLHDANPVVRVQAYRLLTQAEPNDEVDAWLHDGLSDGESQIREACLIALVERGDAYAIAHALELLEGHLLERSLAIRALRASWVEDSESALQAFERIVRMFEASEGGAGNQRVSILQALSQVPGRAAAEYLMGVGARLQGTIKGLDAFRWCVGQTFNTGPAGRALLRELLATETEPFRRLSLIEFIWQDHSAEAREVLLGVLQDDAREPLERLYAADRLLQVGPAAVVAPVLKRVYLASTDRHVRPAMQCMLWMWYGQHYDIPR